MKKLLILPLFLVLIGCDVPKSARDAIAADYGFIITARDQNVTSCQATPTQTKCVAINKAIDVHTAAIVAFNAYCSGPVLTGSMPYSQGGECSPVKSAETGLKVAIDNLHDVTASIKEIIR